MDRRKRKTLFAIQKALTELLQTKTFEEITISDIAEKADISRGTFYLHYVDKYAMIDQLEKQLLEKIQLIFEANLKNVQSSTEFLQSRYPTFVQLFTCLQEEKEVFQIVQQTKGALSLQQGLTSIIGQVFDQPSTVHLLTPIQYLPHRFYIPIIVSIITGTAQQWFFEDENYTPETLAKGMLNILINGPAKVMGLLPGDLIDINAFLEKK